jgi:hypothetical protein
VTSRSRATLGVVGATLSLGCYTYVPATLEAVPVGTEVRALLSTEKELALRDSLGIEPHPLHGTLVDRQDGRLLLSVRTAIGSRELGSQLLYQRVGVTPQDVLRVDVRRLQRTKTAAFALALASAGALLAVATVAILRPGSPGGVGAGLPE